MLDPFFCRIKCWACQVVCNSSNFTMSIMRLCKVLTTYKVGAIMKQTKHYVMDCTNRM
jgi:hypothetical protein